MAYEQRRRREGPSLWIFTALKGDRLSQHAAGPVADQEGLSRDKDENKTLQSSDLSDSNVKWSDIFSSVHPLLFHMCA